jgi:hypothetical protein
MYLKTENLQALINGHELNLYQKSLAKKELEILLTLLKDNEEAITVTRCCESDSEQLKCKHTWIVNHHQGTRYCSKGCDNFEKHTF